MRTLKLPIIASLVVSMAACTTVTDPVNPQPEVTPSAKKQGADQVTKAGVAKTKTGLPAQVVNPGECGLFLWTRRESPEFVFFAIAGTEQAKFWYEKTELALVRTGAGGDVFGQELTEQVFKLPDGRTLELEMKPGDLLVSGQRVPEATLRIKDAEGWSTLVPAAGVTMCQPNE